MERVEIKIQVFNGTETDAAVYVLSRGKNSGKPLKSPCPNCYKIQAPPEILSEVRAVAQILFISGRLQPHFRGSVIDFVTVAAYRSQFGKLWQSISPQVVSKTAQTLALIESNQANIQKQMQVLNQLRRNIALAALK